MDRVSVCTSSKKIFENEYLLLFCNDEILLKEQEGIIQIPSMYDIKILNIKTNDMLCIGLINSNTYYAARLRKKDIFVGYTFKKLRQLFGYKSEECRNIVFRAFHIINWLKNNTFCGCCGGVMQVVAQPQEIAVHCLACGNMVYPRISPAIIVAVIKKNKILLAHSNRFPPGLFSVIAGFVEPGETLENCVRRELQEEIGIEVNNIKYFGNQPWPFPDSLMIAFTAEYACGEITVDNNEIVTAGWFSADTLPDIPDKGSVARQLIDWFLKKQ